MIVILGIILGSLLVLMGLTCCILGFRPVGIAGGSCAACCQSIIGNVVKGSCFAIMTCLAMRGCFIALIIVGLLTLIGIGIYLMINSEWFQSACTWIKKTFLQQLELKPHHRHSQNNFKITTVGPRKLKIPRIRIKLRASFNGKKWLIKKRI